MGRKKIVIKPIANERNKQVTLTKRKYGLMKKAYELSILCGCEIGLIILGSDDRKYVYGSHEIGATLRKFISSDEEEIIESHTNRTMKRLIAQREGTELGADDQDDADDGQQRTQQHKPTFSAIKKDEVTPTTAQRKFILDQKLRAAMESSHLTSSAALPTTRGKAAKPKQFRAAHMKFSPNQSTSAPAPSHPPPASHGLTVTIPKQKSSTSTSSSASHVDKNSNGNTSDSASSILAGLRRSTGGTSVPPLTDTPIALPTGILPSSPFGLTPTGLPAFPPLGSRLNSSTITVKQQSATPHDEGHGPAFPSSSSTASFSSAPASNTVSQAASSLPSLQFSPLTMMRYPSLTGVPTGGTTSRNRTFEDLIPPGRAYSMGLSPSILSSPAGDLHMSERQHVHLANQFARQLSRPSNSYANTTVIQPQSALSVDTGISNGAQRTGGVRTRSNASDTAGLTVSTEGLMSATADTAIKLEDDQHAHELAAANTLVAMTTHGFDSKHASVGNALQRAKKHFSTDSSSSIAGRTRRGNASARAESGKRSSSSGGGNRDGGSQNENQTKKAKA